MSATKIEWTDYTINPIVGCSHCSPGCQHCYAERFAARLAKNPRTSAKYADVVDKNGKWTGRMSRLDMSCFDKLPKKPNRVFVGSMTDLFHENASFDDQGKILSKIANMPQHTFLLLTKRPENVWKRYHTMIPHLWLGVTVCTQQEADEKIPVLLQIPAAKRFISVEPMLGVFNIKKYLSQKSNHLDWVICGAETGPGARHMNLDWARYLRDQCQKAEVPFFFKKASGKEAIPPDLTIRQFPEA